MQEIWTRIEQWLKENAPRMLMHLYNGALDQDIQQIENVLGYTFPEDVKRSLMIHNGTSSNFIGRWGFLNIETILREQKIQLEVLNSFQDEYYDADSDEIQESVTWWWHSHWIPLLSDGAGNLICVEVSSTSGNQFGQLVYFDHESGSRWIAPSFRVWLSAFLHDLEHGKYVVGKWNNLHSEEVRLTEELFPGSVDWYEELH